MKALLSLLLLAIPEQSTDGFDALKPGAITLPWRCGVTGAGNPTWTVGPEPGTPSPPQALRQSASGDYPWCVRSDVAIVDGFVEVRFKPISGKEDQAGGLVWRWKDGNNYYIARANALEDNVTIYTTIGGRRRSFKSADIEVASSVWHTLRVEFTATRFTVLFDGKRVLDAENDGIIGPGAVGVWTKADSVTAFDDFRFGPLKKG